MLLPMPLLPVEQIAERSELLILAVPDDELPGLSPTWRPREVSSLGQTCTPPAVTALEVLARRPRWALSVWL